MHPTRKLVAAFAAHAPQIKSRVAPTFGFASGADGMDDACFGGCHMALRILSDPPAMEAGVGFDERARMLSSVGPPLKTRRDVSSKLTASCGTSVKVGTRLCDARSWTPTRGKSAQNLIAVDLPWIGQRASEGRILPPDDIIAIIAAGRGASSDVHSAAWQGSACRCGPCPGYWSDEAIFSPSRGGASPPSPTTCLSPRGPRIAARGTFRGS